ncbi:hypothetical protein [Mesorhizobium sp. KR1-2]|uniref:hypothetical protein n=1 Tax=Mesorhizobium sp. KR1-2 TaxID=3156609 RepID=UPI0032B338B1
MFPYDWYWRADDGRIYSSAKQALVDAENADFLDFGKRAKATRWPVDDNGEQSDDALAAVLTPHGLRLWPLTLKELKAVLLRSVDEAAEAERLKYITPGAGQAMTYQRKVEEARRLVALAEAEAQINAAEFPMLSATVGLDGDTLDAVARLVIDMDAAWARVGAAIEAVRMATKQAIDAAEDEEAARAVVPAWPAAAEG